MGGYDNRYCGMADCRKHAVRWLKNTGTEHDGAGFCQKHYEETLQVMVDESMRDPVLRGVLDQLGKR